MAEPAEKKQKTQEGEERKAPEPPKELEEDAKPVKDKQQGAVDFLVPDTTLNLIRSTHGSLLMSLQDHGLQYLLAGARASVGVKSGRYMFEVKIVECTNPTNPGGPHPQSLLKIGFTTAGSSLLFDGDETSVCFDSEGHFGRGRNKVCAKLSQGNVVSCLLNLQKGHPNCNTVSLFKDGRRIAQPQPLPEGLKGKTLFPTVAFKCMSLHTNFGPEPLCELPFKCHMVGAASKAESEVKTHTPPKECELLFPVSLPDEGSFDWLDMFLAKNPNYVELSDRMIRDWAKKSAYWKTTNFFMSSKDKPEMAFGVQKLDDGVSVKKMLRSLAMMQKRNYVVMEVKGNLVKEDREALLKSFEGCGMKTTAVVLVGDPPVAFRQRSRDLLLKSKQEASDKEHKKQQDEIKKKWMFAKRQKEIERNRKKDMKAKQKLAKERQKALEQAKKKALGDAAAAEEAEPEKEEEEEPEVESDDEPEPAEEDPPKVTLDDDEKKITFRPVTVPDLTPKVQNTMFMKFSIPDADEGFDSIKYEWTKEPAKAKKFVEDWIASKKLTTRVEDVNPSQWFWSEKKRFEHVVSEWHQALGKYKAGISARRSAKAAKEAKKRQAELKAAAAKAKAEAEAKKRAEAGEAPKEEEKPAEEPAEVEEEEEEETEQDNFDFDGLDVFGVDDVKDVAHGIPLFKEWMNDDWTLLNLAVELHLLGHSIKKDIADADRAAVHVDHLDFYMGKYWKKSLNPKHFGVETVKEVVELVKDVAYIDDKGALKTTLPEELEGFQVFAKCTEEARRFRLLQIDLGHADAALKISPNAGAKGEGGQKRKGDWGEKGGGAKGAWAAAAAAAAGWAAGWGPAKKGKGAGK